MPKFKIEARVIVTCEYVIEASDRDSALVVMELMDTDEWLTHSNRGDYIDHYDCKEVAAHEVRDAD